MGPPWDLVGNALGVGTGPVLARWEGIGGETGLARNRMVGLRSVLHGFNRSRWLGSCPFGRDDLRVAALFYGNGYWPVACRLRCWGDWICVHTWPDTLDVLLGNTAPVRCSTPMDKWMHDPKSSILVS
jgi:hypothetical protein